MRKMEMRLCFWSFLGFTLGIWGVMIAAQL